MQVAGLDHVAITVADVDVTIAWYERVLGAELLHAEAWRNRTMPVALVRVGGSRLSIHPAAAPASPHAVAPTPGSADICFRVLDPIDEVRSALTGRGITIVEGPVPRPAADGERGQSVYCLDPDGNLVELLSTATRP